MVGNIIYKVYHVKIKIFHLSISINYEKCNYNYFICFYFFGINKCEPFLNPKNINTYLFKGLNNIKVVDDSLISHQNKYTYKNNKNFFSINLLPFAYYSAIQYQFFYERKITPTSSIELFFAKKNPYHPTISQDYSNFFAKNPYREIAWMRASESYTIGLFYKHYINKGLYFSPGFIYRDSWYTDQSVKWKTGTLFTRTTTKYNDRADVNRQDIGLRLLVGYKFIFRVFGDKTIFLDCYSGLEVQHSEININHHNLDISTRNSGDSIMGNEYVSIASHFSFPQIGVKLGFGL